MNLLTPTLIDQCKPGGVVLFAGGLNPFVAGPGTALTGLIDAMTPGVPVALGRKVKMSHTAVCMPSNGKDPYIYESTISGKISGPQRSSLASDLAVYAKGKGHAWLFPFLPQFEPDWASLEATALRMIAEREAGNLPYNVRRLFADAELRSWVFDLIALPADGIIAYLAAHSKGVVCSEMAGLLIQGGGVVPKLTSAGIPWLPNVHPPGQPITDAPADIGLMPMFQPAIQLL